MSLDEFPLGVIDSTSLLVKNAEFGMSLIKIRRDFDGGLERFHRLLVSFVLPIVLAFFERLDGLFGVCIQEFRYVDDTAVYGSGVGSLSSDGNHDVRSQTETISIDRLVDFFKALDFSVDS